jgi:hypothetical protein
LPRHPGIAEDQSFDTRTYCSAQYGGLTALSQGVIAPLHAAAHQRTIAAEKLAWQAQKSMIRKSGDRFSLATNAERVCAEIMLKQKIAPGPDSTRLNQTLAVTGLPQRFCKK